MSTGVESDEGRRVELLVDRFRAEPNELDRELHRAWHRAVRNSDRIMYRAMTLNFIAFCPARAADDVYGVIDRLLIRHPTRAFVFLLDEHLEQPYLDVEIRVRDDGRARQLILERSTMRVSPRNRDRMLSTVMPSLLNDLPRMLYWGGDEQHLEVLDRIAGIADRIVYDTALFRTAALAREAFGPRGHDALDLAVFRLRPWRRALAEAFELFTWHAKVPTRVQIRHRPEAAAQGAGEMLGAWLRDKLGAEVELRGSDAEGPLREPVHVRVDHADHATVDVTHMWPRRKLEVRVTLRSGPAMPFQIVASRGQRGDLLAAAADSCW